MSAKWRALQHRHRYTYNAVIFPSSYTQSLFPLSSNPKTLSFFNQLTHFTSLTSIYSQVTDAKTLASSFSALLNSLHCNGKDSSFDGYLLELASRVYLEVLFFENSLPLHRTLVSALSKISDSDVKGLVVKCFRELCEEYGGEKRANKRFCLSRVALSVMGMQKLGFLVGVVEDCAVLACRDVVMGLESVVLETQDCARPSPIVLEQCQESLSCLYYLLQRFPGKFKSGLNGFDGEELVVMDNVLEVLIRLLKSSAFSRDCFVAAGVSLCAALQVCLGAKELGLFISEGIFNLASNSLAGNSCECEFRNVILKIPFKGDLCLAIHSFSLLSRLCLIRGILTAVSRTILNNHFVVPIRDLDGRVENRNFGGFIKTILYNGILPELCDYCENPIDSHFNFHALTVLQICLQQMKTSILSNLTELLDNYDPIPDEMGTRILRIIWNNLEDPLSQTVKQVNLIFDLFLDIHSTLHWGEGSESIKSFLRKIASDLLHLGARCKGRYVPLASLTKRLGAKAMLDMCPTLLFETVKAYIDDDVCCAATTFLKCFLECLRDECWNINGVLKGYIIYRGYCLPPFLYGLASGVSKLRSNLNTYALSVLLDLDMDSVFPMLAFISVGPSDEENGLLYLELSDAKLELGVEQKVGILVSVLKVCRSLAIIEGDIDFSDDSPQLTNDSAVEGKAIMNPHAVVCIKGIKVKVPVEWLVLALIHVDESLRVDAAEALFLNPKTSSLPSHLELSLLKEAVPLNMRSCSTGFQMKWTSLFRKFFSRVRTALDRYYKLGIWQPLKNGEDSKACTSKGIDEAFFSRAEDLFNFMKWLCCFLFFSCYPSAPYKRKIMAMELLLIMINVWPLFPSSDTSDYTASYSFVCPYSKGITSPESTLLFVGSIIDSWDRLRESSFRMLLYFPTPLPGISSDEIVQSVITWAKKLVCSPRVRESDAGALILRLIFRKYVLDLGWMVRASADVFCSRLQLKLLDGHCQITEFRAPVVEYIRSLLDWLNASVEEGERNLSEACKNSFVHGVLLALRYTFEELEWDSDAVVSCFSEMRLALDKLLELVMRITSLALWVVSADAWYLPDMDDMADDDSYLMDELEGVKPSLETEASDNSRQVHDNRSTEQIVMVGCWLAMKEVSLLLGTIIRKIPLPSSFSNSLDSESKSSGLFDKSTLTISEAMIDFKQLEEIGNHFLEVLLKMKHNGAIDKTRAGFTALCNRLLCSNDPRLCMLTEFWLDQLMARTIAKEQTVDDLLRRSAGIPAAFIALFLSEPEGSPKKLLPRALRWLIDVASNTLLGQVNADNAKFSSTMSGEERDSEQSLEVNSVGKNSKIRDEGVIPTVHAFNVLRASFNDTNLATDTSGFAAEALIISIRSFSSPYWEVRNSACLAYTALVRRMIGFLNVQKRESARRALTGVEFFHRYPSLHPFFYNELKVATDLLSNATSSSRHPGLDLAKAVHPSLCPMLILLSRLKPSTVAIESGDDLDPFLLMPFIRRCSTQSNLRIRVLASRALVSMVSNEKLQMVLLNIASELHCLDNQINNDSLGFSPSLTNGIRHLPFNLIHGMLLQLSSLLDANCRNLVDFGKKEKILGDLINILRGHSWIARPRQCPCPIVNASFLRVLDHMLSIARMGNMSENFYAIRILLLELSNECLDTEYSCALPYYDPTIAELREQAALSYFSCIYEASKDEAVEILQVWQKCPVPDSKLLKLAEAETAITFPGLQERLISSLLDSSYEVRLATLKWLLKFLKSVESNDEGHHCPSHEIKTIQNWNKSNLQPTMMKLLESEKHHRCMYYILRILVAWNSLQFQQVENGKRDIMYIRNLAPASVFLFWDKLTSLYKLTRHTKTREALICCMAICMKCHVSSLSGYILANPDKKAVNSCQSDELDNSIHLYECVAFFVNLIKIHSSSSEQVTMRNAVAESIILSGLLEQAELLGSFVVNLNIPSENPGSSDEPKHGVHVYACHVLEAWFCCIKLLEDEDDEIRQRLASKVQRSLIFENCRRRSSAGGVPTQVEKVIEQIFHHLSSAFGHWVNYFDYLAQWVLNSIKYVAPSGDMVRRVFDKEIDNHHEEKLLICQICCSHLEKLPILQSWTENVSRKNDFSNFLYRWRMRFFDQLMSFAKDHIGNLGVEWMGGVVNQKDAFLPLYANLLGFYALSNCIFNGKKENGMPLLLEVVELGKPINTFLSNPLISNLYSLVVKSHEKNVGAVADGSYCKLIDNNVWDSFNPYFLLR